MSPYASIGDETRSGFLGISTARETKLTRRQAIMLAAETGVAVAVGRACLGMEIDKRLMPDARKLAKEVQDVSHERSLAFATQTIRSGVDQKTFLAAVFLAGVADIRPWPCGGKLHAVMSVESVFQLAERSTPKEAWLATLWSLEQLKLAQARDRQQGDWALSARPKVPELSANGSRQEFLNAMDAWDPQRADRAITGLLQHCDHDTLFEVLWPVASRCFGAVGHKIIYAAQADRVLRRIGWSHAEPVVRSVVNGLLFEHEGHRFMDANVRSLDLAGSIPNKRPEGQKSTDATVQLLAGLRIANSKNAQGLVAQALRDGLHPSSIWDAMRLCASEQFLHRSEKDPSLSPAFMPVHPATAINALGHAWRSTKVDSTMRLLILQAAGWLPDFRAHLERKHKLRTDGPRIDEIDTSSVSGEADVFIAGARRRLLNKGAVESHQIKYAAALQEDYLLIHPRWQKNLLGASLGYLPDAETDETKHAQRASAALHSAGVS